MTFFNFYNKPNRGSNSQRNSHDAGNRNAQSDHDPNRPARTAIIYQSELDYMSRCILDYTDIETGGQLFGFWTATGVPVVAYAIGPGRHAMHHPTQFIQDQDYLQSVGRELHRRYRLQHIGEWHSHHQLGLAHPSGGDVNTMQYGVGKPGFPRLLLCIGNCTRTHTTVNPFNFHENMPRDYVQAAWDVVGMESPYRKLVDRDLAHMLIHPYTKHASHGSIRTVSQTVRETANVKVHWLTENAENVEVMKAFVSMVASMLPNYAVKAEILATGEPQIAIKGAGVNIKLPYGFPSKGPVLQDQSGQQLPDNGTQPWEIGEEHLTATFGRWVAERLAYLIPKPEPVAPSLEPAGNIVAAAPTTAETETEEDLRERRLAELTQQVDEQLSAALPAGMAVRNTETQRPTWDVVAYPFHEGRQTVVRITLPAEFPLTPPEIKYGCIEQFSPERPSLKGYPEEIEYINLYEMFHTAGEVYVDLLQWRKDTPLLKAYLVACVMTGYQNKALREGTDVTDYLHPLLDDEHMLAKLLQQLEQKIKETKNQYNG